MNMGERFFRDLSNKDPCKAALAPGRRKVDTINRTFTTLTWNHHNATSGMQGK